MDLIDDKLYFKKDLQVHLKMLGLPYSYPTILSYERKGLIPSPRRNIESFKTKWRVYTGKEIKEIGESIKNMVKKK